jgi:uncharacterized protein (DUF488 family)
MAALLALLLSAFYVTNAWQTLSVGRWHKPGAAIFPIALGALLAISGLSVLFECDKQLVPYVYAQIRGRLREDRCVRVVISGSSGLIGTALVAHLRAAGHDVLRLVRRTPAAHRG